jgi:hypothetical protein
VNKPIQSKFLVLDAWINGLDLESIILNHGTDHLEKLYVVGKNQINDTTGILNTDDYKREEFYIWRNKKGVLLLTNSSLIVDLSSMETGDSDSIHNIGFYGSATQINKIFAHFSVAINGRFLGSSLISDSLLKYNYSVDLKKTGKLILAIYFDNDLYLKEEDRNLYIESIEINGNNNFVEESNSFITREKTLLTTGYNSESKHIAQYLYALGVDSTIIEIVEFNSARRNQTLEAAKALKSHLGNATLPDFNVCSIGLHGRRSMVTYGRILDCENVGIINVESEKFNKLNWFRSFSGIQKMLDEFTSYLYVWLYLNLR